METSAADNAWFGVAYGNGMFVAVAAGTSGGNLVMTSPDGITWTTRASAADRLWRSVAYGNGLFVAVAASGSGDRVMTSPDGITWTTRASAADHAWSAVTFGNGMFVAVAQAQTGTTNDWVMTSTDGMSWTLRTGIPNLNWNGVAYGQVSGSPMFVAVAGNGVGNRVMTSTNGTTWTSQTSAADNIWNGVAYGNGTFVAVANNGVGNRVMTSTDGTTWATQTSAVDNVWTAVTYGNGLFVAVAGTGTGDRVMTSPDGATWTIRTSPVDNYWTSVAYANGTFVSVAANGTGNRVMISPPAFTVTFDANGGSGSMAPQRQNAPTALTANTFSRNGYVFTGWNTSSTGTGTAYADSATYPFVAAATLYAQWTPAPPPPPSTGGGGGTTVSVPSPPRSVTVSPADGQVTVAWQPPASPGGGTVTYVVTLAPGGGTCTTTGTSCTITGLAPGPYVASVVAVNTAGTSAPALGTGVVPAPLDPLLPLGPKTGGGDGSGDGAGVIADGGLPPAQSLLLADGTPAPVIVRPNRRPVADATGLNIVASGLTMTVAAHGSNGRPLSLTPAGALILPSQDDRATLRITATGIKPGGPVKVFILDNVFVGELTADASGTVSGRLPIPPGLTAGAHTLQINAYAPDDTVRSLSLGVVVRAAGAARPMSTAAAQVFFAPLSAVIDASGRTTLNALAKRTGARAVRTVAIGFVQPLGPTANDDALSTARARAVASYLRSKGVTGAYVVQGKGRAKANTPDSRRVDVSVTYHR